MVRIDKGVIKVITKTIKYLDISNNKLQYLPEEIQDIKNFTKLWISNNAFACNCDMLWMRDWLIDAANVIDKEHVKCHSGKWNGKCEFITLAYTFPNMITTLRYKFLSLYFLTLKSKELLTSRYKSL